MKYEEPIFSEQDATAGVYPSPARTAFWQPEETTFSPSKQKVEEGKPEKNQLNIYSKYTKPFNGRPCTNRSHRYPFRY
jgi:hypothetical protein